MALGSMPASRSCSSARKRYTLPLTIKGGNTAMSSAPIPSNRFPACWNRMSFSVRQRNYLGKWACDKGHNRVPEPPSRITGGCYACLQPPDAKATFGDSCLWIGRFDIDEYTSRFQLRQQIIEWYVPILPMRYCRNHCIGQRQVLPRYKCQVVFAFGF